MVLTETTTDTARKGLTLRSYQKYFKELKKTYLMTCQISPLVPTNQINFFNQIISIWSQQFYLKGEIGRGHKYFCDFIKLTGKLSAVFDHTVVFYFAGFSQR